MITYRTPSTEDAVALAELSLATFVATFGTLYSAADLNTFLKQHKTPEAFRRTLGDSRHRVRIAEDGGRMMGYCKLGLDNTLDDVPPGWDDGVELKELYLRSDVQGAGVGHELIEWALAEARELGAPVVVLSVWSGNARAQRFYQRYGFRHIADTYFMVGNQRDDEFLYGCDLSTIGV